MVLFLYDPTLSIIKKKTFFHKHCQPPLRQDLHYVIIPQSLVNSSSGHYNKQVLYSFYGFILNDFMLTFFYIGSDHSSKVWCCYNIIYYLPEKFVRNIPWVVWAITCCNIILWQRISVDGGIKLYRNSCAVTVIIYIN